MSVQGRWAKRSLLKSASSLVLLAVMTGCSAPTPVRAPQAALQPFATVQQAPYVLHVGDVLAVKFWGNPELDEEIVVRPDGMISLPFVDEVRAEGLSPAELDAELTKRYSGELMNPQITVIVREVRGQRVYVGGEVEEPQAVEISGRMTLVQAIQEASYFTPSARRKEVIVIRTMETGERLARVIDLMPVISGADLSGDIELQASDIVIVPRRKITNINQFIEEYWFNLLPIRFVPTFDLDEL